jgi:hypothetical protein
MEVVESMDRMSQVDTESTVDVNNREETLENFHKVLDIFFTNFNIIR